MPDNPDGKRLQIRVKGHKRSALWDEPAAVVRIYDSGIWVVRPANSLEQARDTLRDYFTIRPDDVPTRHTSLSE
jgi:hypothetical protein